MRSPEHDETLSEFMDLVNIPPSALQQWLATDQSKNAAQQPGVGSTGHVSGRRIVTLLRTKRNDLTDEDLDHMRKVSGCIKRHLAQRPSASLRDTSWRRSLMNWGHDPIKGE